MGYYGMISHIKRYIKKRSFQTTQKGHLVVVKKKKKKKKKRTLSCKKKYAGDL